MSWYCSKICQINVKNFLSPSMFVWLFGRTKWNKGHCRTAKQIIETSEIWDFIIYILWNSEFVWMLMCLPCQSLLYWKWSLCSFSLWKQRILAFSFAGYSEHCFIKVINDTVFLNNKWVLLVIICSKSIKRYFFHVAIRKWK